MELIDLRRHQAVSSIVTTAARQHGLPERVIREVRRYALGKLARGASAHRAIKAAKTYAAVRAGHATWPQGVA